MIKNKADFFIMFCLYCYSFSTSAQTVTTFAGGTQGSSDGVGIAAQFYHPLGIAVANDGTVFVADRTNNLIRKITSEGVVTTLAGSTYGFADGIGAAAKFRSPSGIDVDANGNVYVADQYNYRIRKITPDGMVTTLAGSGIDGFANGAGTVAQFSIPAGVAVATDGTVFVSDTNNQRIRTITPSGVVTTFTGSGIAGFADGATTEAQFSNPAGLTIAADGTIFVADSGNQRIRKITNDGMVTTIAGSGTQGFADGLGNTAQFAVPYDVTLNTDGLLFVADYSNHRIRKITPNGMVTTLAGSGIMGFADGVGTAAQFYLPSGIAMATDQTLFIADYGNNLIRKIAGLLDTTDFQIEKNVLLYPNPASTIVSIEAKNISITQITLSDLNGRILQTVIPFNNQAITDISSLTNGIYLMKIFTEKGAVLKKIIKK